MDSTQIESLSNDELRDLLVRYGQNVVGPVVKTTRKVYENKLKKLLSGGSPQGRGSPTSVKSTPSGNYDRLSTGAFNTTSSSASPTSNSAWARNRNSYGDTSSNNYEPDDDLMEGEESFRYVGPVSDSPPSPYSALGGSLFESPTPPRPSKPLSSTPTHGAYSPLSKPYGFSRAADGGPVLNSKTISYHTGPEPYRRSGISASAAVAPRTAAPRIAYGSPATETGVRRLIPWFNNWNTRAVKAKARQWAPWLVKIFGAIFLIIFLWMVVKRAMRSGIGDEEDESFQLPP